SPHRHGMQQKVVGVVGVAVPVGWAVGSHVPPATALNVALRLPTLGLAFVPVVGRFTQSPPWVVGLSVTVVPLQTLPPVFRETVTVAEQVPPVGGAQPHVEQL